MRLVKSKNLFYALASNEFLLTKALLVKFTAHLSQLTTFALN